ncbi:MAG TPA: MFS transporter [Thermoanaerobaculia bacterium]|nr:MFS transporter [Thermoanaerobaculia bacterium]
MNRRWSIPALAALLYFSEGFPFGIVNETVNLYLSFAKVNLTTIGIIGGVGILWTLKVLWAPLVDLVATYRIWIYGALLAMSVAIAGLGAAEPASGAFWAALLLLAFASATHDIAADALLIRVTPGEQLGFVNSTRVAAYRTAMIVAGGGIALLADRIGWRNALMAGACIPLAIFATLAITSRPSSLSPQPAAALVSPRSNNPIAALLDWLARPGALTLLAVILLYRLGDNAMMAMVRPYWVSRGFSATEIGNVTTTLGMICTILGAAAGGIFVSRFGIFRALVVLGAVQMLSNFAYALVATTGAGRPALYSAAVIETFCGGLGTAAFLSFLMFICDREHAATEYAMLSAVFAIGRTGAVMISGALADGLGFAMYYWLTAALALPGLALLPRIRARLSASATTAAS